MSPRACPITSQDSPHSIYTKLSNCDTVVNYYTYGHMKQPAGRHGAERFEEPPHRIRGAQCRSRAALQRMAGSLPTPFHADCADVLFLLAAPPAVPVCAALMRGGGMGTDPGVGIRKFQLRSNTTCTSRTSSRSPLRCLARRHANSETESMNSSATSSRSWVC